MSMKDTRADQEYSTSFFRFLSTKSQLKLLTAIFFSFAPVALLSMSSFAEQRPWYEILLFMLSAGLFAVGWAFSFLHNLKFLILVIPTHVMFLGLVGYLSSHDIIQTRMSIEGMGCILLIALGYIFFINFINSEGTKSLRLQTEIGLAKQIHSNLVPAIARTTQQLELFGKSIPSSEVGGDLLDVFEENGKLGLYIADVSGHGVQAGVLMGMVKSAMRMRLINSSDLGSLLNDLNQVVFQVKRPEMFVTFACLQFDGSSSAQYTLAGHLPILHHQSASGTLHRLDRPHPPLGVLVEQNYDSQTVQFSPGDLFILLTDGLTEVWDNADQEFGAERIEALIIENADKPLSQLYRLIIDAVQRHGTQMDDQTLLLARVQ